MESKFYPKYISWVKKSYPRAFVYRTSNKFIRGIPDLVACVQGIMVTIEVKENHKVTPIQESTMKQVRSSGGMALVGIKNKVHMIDDEQVWDMTITPFKEVFECLSQKLKTCSTPQ